MPDALTIFCGRLSRGNGRSIDRLTLLLPLTASGVIAEDDFARALGALLFYAPYARDPARLRPLPAEAILATHAVIQTP